MKTGQAAARLLGGHFLGDFRPDLPKSALSIKPVGCFLNPCRAHDHLCKSERTGFRLRTNEHALRNAEAAVTFIKVHSTKLRVALATAFNAKRPDNPVWAFHDSKGATLCVGKHLEKLIELTIDCHRDVLLE
jgi:hypothetical protein